MITVLRIQHTLAKLACAIALPIGTLTAADDWFANEPRQPIDLCVQAALLSDSDLTELAVQAEVTRALGEDAGAWPNPELRLGRPFPADGDGDVIQTALRIDVPRPGQRADERLVAATETAAERARADLGCHELALSVRQAYIAVLMSKRKIALQEKSLALAASRLAALDQRVAAGGANQLDRATASARVIESTDELTSERLQYDADLAALPRIAGDSSIELVEPVIGLPDQDLAALQSLARANRCELRIARQDAHGAEGKARIIDREAWPWFTFAEASCDVSSDHERDYAILVGIDLPVFNRLSGERKAESLLAAAAARHVQRVMARIDGEVAQAHARVRALEAASRRQDEERRSALAELDGIAEAVRGQGGDVLDASVAEDTRLRLALRAEEQLETLMLARLDLHHALGLRGLDDIQTDK